MDDASVAVCVVEDGADLFEPREEVRRIEAVVGLMRLPGGERAAFDVFHDDGSAVAVRHEIMCTNDARVRQFATAQDFVFEKVDGLGILHDGGGHELEGNVEVEFFIVRELCDTHAAASKLMQYAVASEIDLLGRRSALPVEELWGLLDELPALLDEAEREGDLPITPLLSAVQMVSAKTVDGDAADRSVCEGPAFHLDLIAGATQSETAVKLDPPEAGLPVARSFGGNSGANQRDRSASCASRIPCLAAQREAIC